jgi:hypothetical protein
MKPYPNSPPVKPESGSTIRDSCWYCGSKEDPDFSRIVPMGYFCPDCGKDANPVFRQVEAESFAELVTSASEVAEWARDLSAFPHSSPKIRDAVAFALDRFRAAARAVSDTPDKNPK